MSVTGLRSRAERSSAPFFASETAKPSPSKHRRSRVRTFGSSSTTRMCTPLMKAAPVPQALHFNGFFTVSPVVGRHAPVVAWRRKKGIVFGSSPMSQNRGQNPSPSAQAAKLRGILESAVTAIITIDQHGLIEQVNPATERLFGYAGDELVGKNVKVLMPEPYRAEHNGYIANYLKTG